MPLCNMLELQQTCSSLFLASAEDGLPSSLIGEGVWPGLAGSQINFLCTIANWATEILRLLAQIKKQ
jgi:hypothetical protein